MLWGILGIVFLGSGLDPSRDAPKRIALTVMQMLAMRLPMLIAGIRTLNGSIVGLWVNTLFYVIGFSLAVAGFFRCSMYSDLLEDLVFRLPLMGLLSSLAVIGLVAHAIALVSHYTREKPDRR